MGSELGERIRELRESRGWDVQMLASRSGLHLTSIYLIEKNSRTQLRPSTLQQLARAFGITVSALLGEEIANDTGKSGADLEPYRNAIAAAKNHGLSPDQVLQLINTTAGLFAKK